MKRFNQSSNSQSENYSSEDEPNKKHPKTSIFITFLKFGIAFVAVNLSIKFLDYFILGHSFGHNHYVSTARNSEAKTYIISLNSAQQFFYLDTNQFADTIEPLGLGIKSRTQHFDYLISPRERTVLNYGIPRSDVYETVSWGVFRWKRSIKHQLKSYVGGVFVLPQSLSESAEVQIVSVLCESVKSGVSKVAEPRLENNIPICGEGTEKVEM